MFEGYLGQALHVTRVAAGLSQEEVLHELNRRMGSNYPLALFDGMEKDIEEIDIKTFDTWCALLPFSKEKVLKCAQRLQQNAHRSEQDILEGLLSEIEYRQWRNTQENQ